jgi:hypothetical protein
MRAEPRGGARNKVRTKDLAGIVFVYVRSSDLSCIRLHVMYTTGQWGVRLWVKG